MYINIDISQLPPVVDLREADDFGRFDVRVEAPPHIWLTVPTVSALAERSDDPEWMKQFAAMVEYAKGNGWTNDRGQLRAHVVMEHPSEESA